jgi:hypothetical protein
MAFRYARSVRTLPALHLLHLRDGVPADAGDGAVGQDGAGSGLAAAKELGDFVDGPQGTNRCASHRSVIRTVVMRGRVDGLQAAAASW